MFELQAVARDAQRELELADRPADRLAALELRYRVLSAIKQFNHDLLTLSESEMQFVKETCGRLADGFDRLEAGLEKILDEESSADQLREDFRCLVSRFAADNRVVLRMTQAVGAQSFKLHRS